MVTHCSLGVDERAFPAAAWCAQRTALRGSHVRLFLASSSSSADAHRLWPRIPEAPLLFSFASLHTEIPKALRAALVDCSPASRALSSVSPPFMCLNATLSGRLPCCDSLCASCVAAFFLSLLFRPLRFARRCLSSAPFFFSPATLSPLRYFYAARSFLC